MGNILIVPEKSDGYRALSGDKESTGRTPGEALDALRSQLTEEEAGTLVIMQSYKPDRFFNAAQKQRLDELIRLRDADELTAEDELELEGLIDAELRGATERVEAMPQPTGQKVFSPPLPQKSYIARVAQESLMHAQEVRRQIMTQTLNYDLAGDVVAVAIPRVIKYAGRYGPTQEIGNVKALLVITARILLLDAQPKRLKADKKETVSRDSTAGGGLPSPPDESSANEIGQAPQDPYLERIAGECMAYRVEVEEKISLSCRNPALAEDIVAQAIQRVVEHADRHRGDDEKKIENVRAYLMTTANRLLIDALTGKAKADKVQTVSWDASEGGGPPNVADESPTSQIEQQVEAAQMKQIALRDATPAQKQLFEMWFERGMNSTEISRHLGISSAQVRHRIQTLMGLMRTNIEKLI